MVYGSAQKPSQSASFTLYRFDAYALFPLTPMPHHRWRESQRFRLLYLTSSNSTSPRKLRRTSLDRLGREYQVDDMTTLEALNERYSNIKPTHGPVQCKEELCEYLRETMRFVEKAGVEEMGDHRFVMDVDGNACVRLDLWDVETTADPSSPLSPFPCLSRSSSPSLGASATPPASVPISCPIKSHSKPPFTRNGEFLPLALAPPIRAPSAETFSARQC
jgi:hypothetical protein